MTESNDKREITCDVREHICVLANKENGWRRELNLVVWNGKEPPKYDIRDWSPTHERMSRGITLYSDEMSNLYEGYREYVKNNDKVMAKDKEKETSSEAVPF